MPRTLAAALLACSALAGMSVAARAGSVSSPPSEGVPEAAYFAKTGIDSHFQYTDGQGLYANVTSIEQAMSYLGLTLFRDGLPSDAGIASPTYIARADMEKLSQAGYRFSLIPADYTQTAAYETTQFKGTVRRRRRRSQRPRHEGRVGRLSRGPERDQQPRRIHRHRNGMAGGHLLPFASGVVLPGKLGLRSDCGRSGPVVHL